MRVDPEGRHAPPEDRPVARAVLRRERPSQVAEIGQADEPWRVLLDRLAEGVAVLDATDRRYPILEANDALRRLQPDPARPLPGRPWLDAFPDTGPDLLAALGRVAAGGAPETGGEARPGQEPPAGRSAFWDWQCLPLRGADGAVERLLVLVRDVTDRVAQERGREFNLRLLEHIPIGIATTSGAEHQVTQLNERFAHLAGLAPADLFGRPLAVALPGLGGDLADQLDRVYRTGEPFASSDVEVRAAGAGEPSYWSLVVLPLPGLRGGSDGVMLMALDNTAQARARREVESLAAAARRRAGQLEAVIGSMADGVFILDAEGLVAEVNEAGLRLLGLPPTVQSRRLSDYLAPLAPRRADGRSLDPESDLAGLLAGVLAGRVLPAEQLVIGGAEGTGGQDERVLSLSGAPVREEGGRIAGAVVLLRDISAQRRADQEKDAFLSLVSHEVKSPLTSIKGFAQLARRAAEQEHPEGRVGRHLQVIDQQVERIERLVDELAQAGRLQKGTLQLEPVGFDLAALARTLVEQQQVTISSHTLDLVVRDEPLPVRADPARIEQVLSNLLTNAVKYSPQADRVTITLERDGDQAHLAVRDEGIGVPRAEQGRLFGRFYRGSNASRAGAGGLGLGLYIAHEIVVRSGGRIWAESAEGRGSTFHVTLPLAYELTGSGWSYGALS